MKALSTKRRLGYLILSGLMMLCASMFALLVLDDFSIVYRYEPPGLGVIAIFHMAILVISVMGAVLTVLHKHIPAIISGVIILVFGIISAAYFGYYSYYYQIPKSLYKELFLVITAVLALAIVSVDYLKTKKRT